MCLSRVTTEARWPLEEERRACMAGFCTAHVHSGGDNNWGGKFILVLIVRGIQRSEIFRCGEKLFTNHGPW